MAFSPRNPKASRIENRCLDTYSSDSTIGGVIYELNFATSFPIQGAPSDIEELFANIHGRVFYKAYQPAWKEMEGKGVPESDAFERMCFIESNVLVAITGHLDLNFEKVHRGILAKAESFAKRVLKEIQSDSKITAKSIEKHAIKKHADFFIENSYLWKKAVREYWQSQKIGESRKLVSNPIVEKISPGATNWIESQSKAQSEDNTSDDDDYFDYIFTIPEVGWSWICDYHKVFGLCDDENEAHFMAGAHMTYVEVDGDVCEIFFRDWGVND
jgi:hypothetical protein